MDIVVKGRNVEVPEHFRTHVADKLSPALRLDGRAFRVDVELFHERNPRQSSHAQRVEITLRSKGPVVRAEATAETFYAALDAAHLKLEARLRRSHDRKRVHHGGKTPPSVAQVTAGLVGPPPEVAQTNGAGHAEAHERVAVLDRPDAVDDTASLVVRDKTHAAQPMTIEQAIHEMELVGHDFFLYQDADTALPSVVYRRHGYDYGVLRLSPEGQAAPAAG